MRNLLVIVLSLAAVGCNADPCAGKKEAACITLTVMSSAITQVNQLRVTSTIATEGAQTKITPTAVNQTFGLPFDIALEYKSTAGQHVALTVEGLVGGTVVGVGATAFNLSQVHQTAVVNLNAGTSLPLDMAAAPPDLTPPSTDMAALPVNKLVAGSYDAINSSDNLIAAITHANQTLEIYDPAGTLQVSLDSGADIASLFIQDNVVVYCVKPVAIGTTANKSCTLKMWKPGATSATQLATGVYPFAVGISPDATSMVWFDNVDATATHADLAVYAGTTWNQAVVTQAPLATASGSAENSATAFWVVPAATAGQFDIAKYTMAQPTVRICQNCDQFEITSDGMQIAARTAIANNLGKVVVGSTALNTAGSLNASATISPNVDVSRLIDFYPGRVMYLSATASSNNLMAFDTANNSVVMRDSSVKAVWRTTADLVFFSFMRNADGTGDLWLVSKTSGNDHIFSAGPGILWDSSSDDYFTFMVEPSATPSGWYMMGGMGVSGTPLFTLNPPAQYGDLLDANRVVFLDGSGKLFIDDFKVKRAFGSSFVVDYDLSRAKKRLLYISRDNPAVNDGIYAYTY